MATQAQIRGMNNFLNPPRGNMDGSEYRAIKMERSVQWKNFVAN